MASDSDEQPLIPSDPEERTEGIGRTVTLAPEIDFSSEVFDVETIVAQLQSITKSSNNTIAVLGTRQCSYLHQKIIELLGYALVLSGNHVITSGATGTHSATIRGALRAIKSDKSNVDLLTVILPQTVSRQPEEVQSLLEQVEQMAPGTVVELGHNELPLDLASRLCNSDILARVEQLIIFAFHDSDVMVGTVAEAKDKNVVTTALYLD
jgi:hypothetical protein